MKRDDFRSMYHIADDEIAIGIIGRIVPVKNHELFVAASKQLIEQTTKKIKLIIVGDGDMREAMGQQFLAAGIDYAYFPEDRRNATAICTSWQKDIDRVLAGVDIVALTSHNEGTPVSLIEAQAARKPIVSTNVGGVSDIIKDGKCGIITEPNNVEEFAAGLLKLVENEGLRKEYGNFGHDYVQAKFSYQRLVKDMSAYYYRLLDEKKAL
jgi:glycosyltransferase involved in cell wall biosynthesis